MNPDLGMLLLAIAIIAILGVWYHMACQEEDAANSACNPDPAPGAAWPPPTPPPPCPESGSRPPDGDVVTEQTLPYAHALEMLNCYREWYHEAQANSVATRDELNRITAELLAAPDAMTVAELRARLGLGQEAV